MKHIQHTLPELEEHEGVVVARDTLVGGTKSRYLWQLFLHHDEVVYASSAEGTAQVALAAAARRWDKRCVIYGPARKVLHPRQAEAIRLGADFRPVKPGYLSCCQSLAKNHAARHGSYLLPFGGITPNAIDTIADTANALKIKPRYVWCASGSGTLVRGLKKAWARAEHHAVLVGHELTTDETSGADLHRYHRPYSYQVPKEWVPFDTDGHYERKSWVLLREWKAVTKPKGMVLFWSVTGAAQ